MTECAIASRRGGEDLWLSSVFMSLSLRWVDESEYDRVAETWMYCHGDTLAQRERLRENATLDRQAAPGAV